MVKAWTAQHGLRLHPDKTQIVHYGEAEQSVEFLATGSLPVTARCAPRV